MIKEYLNELTEALSTIEHAKIDLFVRKIRETTDSGRTIFILGNGGSAATASHMACDINKGAVKDHSDVNEKRHRAISLADNVSTITAISNDMNYEEVFAQQIKNYLSKGDLIISMSASGNSKNLINAVNVARDKGAIILSLLGNGGGKLKDISDDSIIIDSNNYGIIEDAHLVISHLITQGLKGEPNSIKKN